MNSISYLLAKLEVEKGKASHKEVFKLVECCKILLDMVMEAEEIGGTKYTDKYEPIEILRTHAVRANLALQKVNTLTRSNNPLWSGQTK